MILIDAQGKVLVDGAGKLINVASAASNIQPAAPSNIVYNDTSKELTFDLSPRYVLRCHEFTIDGGLTWKRLYQFPFRIAPTGIAANKIGFRVSADNNIPPSEVLWFTQSVAPFTVSWDPTNGLDVDYYSGVYVDEKLFKNGQVLYRNKVAQSGIFAGNFDPALSAVFPGMDYFSAFFKGKLVVTQSGNYDFSFAADDKVHVFLGDAAAEDYPPLSAALTNGGRLVLEPGIYPFKFYFGEIGGAEQVYVQWNVNGAGWTLIPTANLRYFYDENNQI